MSKPDDRGPAALDGICVVDLTDCVAGQFASRLMADYGADVVLVEPSGGSGIRRRGPFLDGRPDESLLFWHLNAGKRSSVVAAEPGDRGDAIIDICRNAHIALVDRDDLARELGQALPDLLVGVVSEFGAGGPYQHWHGAEIVYQALSGSMYVTGDLGREPLHGVGERASYAAGLWLYIGVVAALFGRLTHGARNSPVSVNVHEAAVAMEENFTTRWSYSATTIGRGSDGYRAACSLRCSDGWVVLFIRSGGDEWRVLCDLVEAPELSVDPRFAQWPDLLRNWTVASSLVQEHVVDRTAGSLVRAGSAAGLVVAVVENAQTLLRDTHLRHRRYWQRVAVDGIDRAALGPIFRTQSTVRRDRPAPALGSLSSTSIPWTNRRQIPVAVKDDVEPLAGVSVIEMTTAWSGPMAARILAFLGADVIKVEGPRRYDSWRGQLPPTKLNLYADCDPGPEPYNRYALFNGQNHDKRSIILDLKTDDGREIIRTMLAPTDLVLTNLRPGSLDRLGIGLDELEKLRSDPILIEMTAVGSGPEADRVGLGPTMEAMAGITDLIGYPDGAPIGSGSSYMDPMGALHGAAAAVTALCQRALGGGGQRVEVAQREAAMQWVGEILLESIENETPRRRTGNATTEAAPHNAFATSGEDSWVAIAVFTDGQWRKLRRTLGSPEALADPRFETMDGRRTFRAELDGALTAVTKHWDKFKLAEVLQAAGVPAGPVLDGADLFNDPQLRARRWFRTLTHPRAGTHEYPTLPVVLGGRRERPLRASPTFGEHTDELLSAYIGLRPAAIERLVRAGVISRRPVRASSVRG